MINKLSLKRRLTFFVGTILIAITIILTSLTLTSVKNAMVPLTESANIFSFISGNGIYYDMDENKVYINIDERVSEEETNNENMMGMGHHGRMNRTNMATGHNRHMKQMIERNLVSNIKVAQARVYKNSLYAMFGIIIFGIIGAYIIIDKSLKPLTNLSETIHEIGEDNLNTQIVVPETDDEISSLILSFNKMLKRLEKMFKEQKDFSAKAAHELRTPLTTMKTSLQVLQMDENPPIDEYKENMELVEHNIDRLIDTVNNLFLLSSESIQLNDNIEIDQLIYEIVEDKEEELVEKNIDLKLSLGKLEIPGNKELIYSAISNILENAIKYNKKDGSIFIRAFKTADDMAHIRIEDTGIGMNEKEMKYIFDAFYRVDDSIVEGNGLGLSIVKNIIEEHNGKIEVESQLDKGTDIELIIPLYINSN